MRRFRIASFLTALIFCLFVQPAFSQAPVTVPGSPGVDAETGINPLRSYEGGDIDFVNLNSGKLVVKIPLVSYPQRGGKLNLGFSLIYSNTGVYYPGCYPTAFSSGQCAIIFPFQSGFSFVRNGIPLFSSGCGQTLSTFVYQGGSTMGSSNPFSNPSLFPSNMFDPKDPNGLTLDPGALPDPGFSQTSTSIIYRCAALVSMPDGAMHSMQPIGPSTYMAADASGYRIDWMPGFDVKNPMHQGSILTDSDGNRYYQYPYDSTPTNPILSEDSNGNQITRTTDTMGRDFSSPLCFPVGLPGPYPQGICGATLDYSQCTGSLPIAGAALENFPGIDGGIYPVKFCFVLVPEINPGGFLQFETCAGGNFGCQQVDITTPPLPTTAIQLQSVVLPNGSAWTFDYTTDGFGNLSRITLPTGGTISYTWITQQGPISANSLPSFALMMPFAIQTRTVSPADGTGPSGTWKYNYLRCLSCGQTGTGTDLNTNAWLTVVTDPAQNDTGHFFSLVNGRAPGTGDPVETVTNSYKGPFSNNQILKSVQTDFQVTYQTQDEFATATVVPIRTTTTLDNGLVTKTEQDWDSGVPVVSANYTADGIYSGTNPSGVCTVFGFGGIGCGSVRYGAVVAKREYDFGVGAPGPLLRTTNTPHLALSNANYLNNNLLSLPSGSNVTDANGNVLSSVTFGFDETPPASSGIATQHDPAPPGGNIRGNLTSIHQVVTTPATSCNGNTSSSTTLNKTINWLDTGVMANQTDALGNPTTYSYSPIYAGAYPTTTCNALNQCTNATYDPSFGLKTSFTDANNQVTNYNYDIMGRVKNITYPAQIVNGVAISGSTTISYSDTPGSIAVQYTKKQDANTSITTTSLFDGLARPLGTQLNDPAGNVLTRTTYDGLGRVSTATNPYRSTSDATYGVTQTQYDQFGRPIQVTRPDGSIVTTTYSGRATQTQDEGNGTGHITHISQLDALGRLASVCEVTGATQVNQNAPSACGQDIAGTGFLTSYSYDLMGNLTRINQSNLIRSFVSDSASRLVSAVNPESGTTCYQYDGNGNVLTRTRPAPNQGNPANTVITTYHYDVLNRLLTTSYSDSITPSVTMHYDSSSELGVALNNTIGRLSAQYVTSPSGQLLSGTVYSYDSRGRIIDNSQCTPQNCASSSAFPVEYSYNLLGKKLAATNGVGTTFGYAYDAAGHVTQMTSNLADANHPATLFSSPTYNALGVLTADTLGSALNEAFKYDCRGHLVSYISAVFPAATSLPTGTTPGCPTTVAVNNLENHMGTLQSFFGGPGSRKLLPVRSVGSVLISAIDALSNSEKGSVNLEITSLSAPRHSRLIAVPYIHGETALEVARECARRINSDPALNVSAKVKSLGSAAAIDLVDRGTGIASGFFVSVSVNSNIALPSISATASGASRKLPILLTDLQMPRRENQ